MTYFTKQLWMNPEIYPYLTRWGQSMGYEVITNDPKTLIYGARCIDPVRIRELDAANLDTCVTPEEAADLVLSLESMLGKAYPYSPAYDPLIQVDRDMYDNYFRPYLAEAHWGVYAHHEGRFVNINTVTESSYDPENWQKGGVFCRSLVTDMLRDLEYERRMSPYLVTYNMLKSVDYPTRTWEKGLDTLEKAVKVVESQNEREIPTAEWRIYRDLTAIVRHMTDDFPPEVIKPEGWLWLRIWHPGEDGADCWTSQTFNHISDVRVAIVEQEALDMYAVTAIYACVEQRGVYSYPAMVPGIPASPPEPRLPEAC